MREEDDFGDRNVRRAVRLPSVPRFHGAGTPRNPSGDMTMQTPYRGMSATMSPANSMSAFQSASLQGSPMQTTPLMQGGLWTGGAGPSHHPGMMTPGTLSQQVSLMRTTQIHGGGSLTQSQALGKVALELQGKLSNMALGWSQEEVAASRRLVQFSRSLEDGILKVQFRPISPADYVHGTVVVSCIYRRDGAPDERDKCYITSVDAIQLLEAIIASPFSVEEKNRIRRNLEGFKPITVSKHKPDQENFFKLIMEFPAPKPRNIEKDVKVFKWEHLEQALHKIIDKYVSVPSTHAAMDLRFEDTPSLPGQTFAHPQLQPEGSLRAPPGI
ncbi:hypothetical protein CALCODRAFT_94062 [Calocera cornea HHB12733]|uniref:DUF7082 domain-containing protein n=1 Tax=Calocera cornea HHB12733 TaxID=1353952 RepID=A0A165D7S2_9BASI|nr:hypothetical protein CALCODRAFT_94062 [Calocera cornea HHB12733]